ncbi:MFS transporter [Actinomadura sp. WAC 06369]|uniref:MFS transporter n=1 Tax=Actinomadura sp. WAC 06369 TaxID=2203193 RepID=UPI000F7BA569|nr:MFS transporter [Actinomadura sp. WAC 06369]RSN72077.1 MFS transporter [Actinomadura sp. WAC 06369]
MTAPHRAGTARCAPAPRGRTLAVVGALYLVANTGYSFFFLALGTILLSRDVPLGAVAAINMLGAVYFLRFLTAPIIDRARPSGFGRYRGWLLLTQPPLIATLAALAALDPVADLPLTLALTIVFLGLSVFHDTALNGLAVRLLRRGEHGVGNGVQMASASASLLIGSSGALLLYAHAGWTVTLLALAAVHLVPFAVLTRIREPPEPDGRAAAAPRVLGALFRDRRAAAWALLVIPVFAVSEWLATAVQPAMLLSAGWSTDRIALATSAATGAQVVAALATGAAVGRYGRTRPALVTGVLGIAGVAALLPLAAGHAPLVPTLAAMTVVSIVYGAKVTWIAATSMALARPASAATDYSVPMAIEGIFVTVASSAALALAAAAGFTWTVALAAVLAVAGAVVAPRWRTT